MQKSNLLSSCICILILFSLVLSSCKDDDKPAAKPKLSFNEATKTVNEADGLIQVEVSLDKPASEDITIEYSLSGTAVEKTLAGTNQPFDYEVVSDFEEIEIDKGETSGIIEIQLSSDGDLEDDETIGIDIKSVSSESIEITRDDEIVITVKQEDGVIIALTWPEPSTDGAADMDILVRGGSAVGQWQDIITGSVGESDEGPEALFLPKTAPFNAFGVSYIYYGGTYDPLPFRVLFIDVVNGEAEADSGVLTFDAQYTAANKNPWTTETANSTQVVQTFVKSGGNFTDISQITVPASGSRIGNSNGKSSSLKKTIEPISIPLKYKKMIR